MTSFFCISLNIKNTTLSIIPIRRHIATFVGIAKDNAISGRQTRISRRYECAGHSDRTANGLQIGETDAGTIYMPDGELCHIAVFVKDSKESDPVNARIIADIARLVYERLTYREKR